MSSVCASHGAVATDVCARCGAFICERCRASDDARGWCTACLARPELRWRVSPRAKRAVLLALLGFHGVVFLLPVAWWMSRAELEAISAGLAPPAGGPYAQGALAVAVLGSALWLGLAVLWTTSSP